MFPLDFKKSILSAIFAISFGLSSLKGSPLPDNTQSPITHRCPWDDTLIKHVHPNQNAPQLIECIPLELQDLPYAIYPTDVDYNTARFNYNKRYNVFPKAILCPRTYEEAQFVLSILKKYCLKFSIRSGGHCLGPGSLSSDYIFDCCHFNSIIPDIENEQVFLGAGCRLGTVIDTLGKIDYAIPTGTCPTVGVTGLACGGGIGLLGRQFGLTCDSVIRITLLNANLEIIEVDEENYPDLFWAMRGAGNGSFGIVLGLTFKMYYIPEVTFYEISWKWDHKLIPCIFHAWQPWVANLPSNITSVLGIRHPDHMCCVPQESEPLVIRIFGLKIGSEPFTEWEYAFKHLNPSVKLFTGTYREISKLWTNESLLPFDKLKSKILMKPITNRVIKKISRFFERLEREDPELLVYFNFEAFGGNIPKFNTAFFPRCAFGWWEFAYYWDEQDDSGKVLTLSEKFYKTIPREVSKYCYANIVDYSLGKDYLELYYGDHVDCLITIKNKYDPKNLFYWKQGIPTNRCGCNCH